MQLKKWRLLRLSRRFGLLLETSRVGEKMVSREKLAENRNENWPHSAAHLFVFVGYEK